MSDRSSVRASSAAAVLEHHFGKRPSRVKRLTGGIANHVFEARLGKEYLIVRISDDPAKLQTFIKEQWAVRKARKHGIPTPQILEVGNTVIDRPYMISEKISGIDATGWPHRLQTARDMGGYARRINSIKASGFGAVFDWSHNHLSRNKTWAQFLDGELHVEDRLELFAAHKMMPAAELLKLRKSVAALRRWRGKPALTHGDIRFKNVILDETGKIRAILDWENCSSNLAPHWELSIALHDLCIDEKQAFLEGYGLSVREYAKIAATIKTLNILNYFSAIDAAVRQKDRRQLDALRARLHGAFDLHSL